MGGRSRPSETTKIDDQLAEKKKGFADWINLIKPGDEEKDHWVPDESSYKVNSETEQCKGGCEETSRLTESHEDLAREIQEEMERNRPAASGPGSQLRLRDHPVWGMPASIPRECPLIPFRIPISEAPFQGLYLRCTSKTG
ncbi:hypothetical protein SAY87_012594 [Trapa incisa]|uniref:Uncharacterized protein n=1 Tax=Trapa incisa TaxID=236973 RepID=A0AAN7GTM0_9MYRT|nr:hypothetical protein SAY87_012594 [Trapa incisa]